jgi:hypothetical protein
MTNEQLQQALGLALPYSQNVADETSCAFVIQGVPSLASAGCINIAVAITAAVGLTCTLDYGAGLTTPVAADQAGFEVAGSNNTLTYATYTTLGTFIDAINGTKFLRAYLVAGIRSDIMTTGSTSPLLARTVLTCIGDNGLPIYFDGSLAATATPKVVGIAISGEKFVNNGKNGWIKEDLQHEACINSLIYAKFAAAFSVSTARYAIYHSTQAADVEVLSAASTTTTVYTLQAAAGDLITAYSTAPIGSRVILRMEALAGTTGFTTGSANTYIQATGKSAVLSGRRIVTEDNY